jgi:pimeloyl-ACP methyl ester carboxylesterase
MIKKIVLLALLFISALTAKAQNKPYTETTDSLLQFLNKKTMQTDILYDRVMPFANLTQIKDTTDFEYFRQAWSELFRSSYNPEFKSVYEIYSKTNNTRELQTMPLGILDARFEIIDTTKIDRKDEFLYAKDKSILFLEKQVSSIAPLKSWVATTSTVQFSLAAQLLQNERKISSLEVSFDGKSFVFWIENGKQISETFSYNYTTSGNKFIQFRITFDDKIVVNRTSSIDVRLYATNSTQRLHANPMEEDFIGDSGIVATIPFRGYNDTYASQGKLEYRVYYNRNDNDGSRKSIIKKPVIVLDGFDPGDLRKIYPRSIGYDEENLSLYELMGFGGSENDSVNLVDLLRSEEYGYDVILVNFQEGADYIERNAMAVIALLERVNKQLEKNDSREEVVMIGPSMGGFISRYALTYMEQNNMNHNTRLWVSFDSPHLGANIPLAAQAKLYFFGYLGEAEAAKESFDTNFCSPAARQMLIEQLDYIHEKPYLYRGVL